MLSAVSAASPNVWVASRYLFFLARRGHAPSFFGSLYQSNPTTSILPFEGHPATYQPVNNGVIPVLQARNSHEELSIASPGMLVTGSSPPCTPPTPLQSVARASSSSHTGESFASLVSSESATALLEPHRRIPSVTGPITLPAISLMGPVPLNEDCPRPLTSSSTATAVLATPSLFRPPTRQSVSTAVSQSLTTVTTTTRSSTGPCAATASADSLAAERLNSSNATRPGSEPRMNRSHEIKHSSSSEVVVPWVGVLFGGVVGLLVFMVPEARNDNKVEAVRRSFWQR